MFNVENFVSLFSCDTVIAIANRPCDTEERRMARAEAASYQIEAFEPRDGAEVSLATLAVMYQSVAADLLFESNTAATIQEARMLRRQILPFGRLQLAAIKEISTRRAAAEREAKAALKAPAQPAVNVTVEPAPQAPDTPQPPADPVPGPDAEARPTDHDAAAAPAPVPAPAMPDPVAHAPRAATMAPPVRHAPALDPRASGGSAMASDGGNPASQTPAPGKMNAAAA